MALANQSAHQYVCLSVSLSVQLPVSKSPILLKGERFLMKAGLTDGAANPCVTQSIKLMEIVTSEHINL